jgi:hypothetical protein
MTIQNILPDPYHLITPAGDSEGGVAGPGYASVSLSSNQPIMRDRTNSGRLVSRVSAYHNWEISISYNPLTELEFNPVYSFLLHKQGTLKSFFVSLPQYRDQGITDRQVSASIAAGSTTIPCTTTGIVVGALLRINDPSDSAHTKAYMVNRVGASSITVTPGLAKFTSATAILDFTDPTIKVIQSGDTQQYSLNTENLYSFSLKLEEVNN